MRCTAIAAVAKSLTALASLDMGANIAATAISVVVQNANKMVRQRSRIRCIVCRLLTYYFVADSANVERLSFCNRLLLSGGLLRFHLRELRYCHSFGERLEDLVGQ